MEPINEKYARQLIQKLSGLPGAKDKDQMGLRAETLRNKARGPAHAARVVQSLLESSEFFPTVRALVEACEYTPDDAQVAVLRKNCRHCNGDGWRSVDGPYETSAGFPCSHRDEFTEAETRLGVPVPPGVQRLYQAQQTRGNEARAKHAASGAIFGKARNPDRRGLERITPEMVQQAVQEYQAKKLAKEQA